jgi:acyl carrier protein
LGKEWGLAPRDLLYLFFDIENEFGISIPEEAIEKGKFDTINNIAGIISLKIEKKVSNW